MKNIKNKLNNEDQFAVEDTLNPWSFESYCCSCDNFNTDECPFKEKVLQDTYWKTIGCEKFYD